nr:MAG TPA: Putative minor capsid protein [Microviridae sp.]
MPGQNPGYFQMSVLGTIGGIVGKGLQWAAQNPQLITGAMTMMGKGLQGLYGQQSQSQSQGFNQSQSQGSGASWSKSEGGTNDQQIQEYLKQFYAWQEGQNEFQSKTNRQNMLMQMGYNTLGAIQQGIYNQIERNAAMQYNSAEALKNREFQERMSNTAYQRTVEDMKKAGLNPILAYANGGASTPGGSGATITGASMGLPSASALGVSTMSGNVPNSYYSRSESESQWYQLAEAIGSQMSTSYSSPKQLTEDLLKTYRQMEKTKKTVPTMGGGKAGGGEGRKKKGHGGGGY